VFLSSPLEDLGAIYDDHLRLIGKRVDFLLVLIELFSLGTKRSAQVHNCNKTKI